MVRPCLALDPPPTVITVGGLDYTLNTDYRVWIDIQHDMQQLLPTTESDEDVAHNALVFTLMTTKAFGKPLKIEKVEQMIDFMKGATEFLKGYPQPPVSGSTSSAQTFSFEHDINAIIIAFRKYYGIDISYARKEPFHWWLFLEYFRNLCGDDLMILRLMQIRGYDGQDKEMRKAAARFALPKELSAAEKRMMDDICSEFYGAQ